MTHWKGFALATGKGAWKSGAFLLKWGSKGAAKGSVWVLGGRAGAMSADYYRNFDPDPDGP